MYNHDWLAKRLEENRTHLKAVAYRMLGSIHVLAEDLGPGFPPPALFVRRWLWVRVHACASPWISVAGGMPSRQSRPIDRTWAGHTMKRRKGAIARMYSLPNRPFGLTRVAIWPR